MQMKIAGINSTNNGSPTIKKNNRKHKNSKTKQTGSIVIPVRKKKINDLPNLD